MIFRFADPAALLFLLVVPVILVVWLVRKGPRISIGFPLLQELANLPGAVSSRPIWIPRYLRIAAIIVLTIAAARPQSGEVREVVYSEGVDIVVALDISGSMRALDFQPQNRLEVAKNVIGSFIDGRPHDRIGLVLFGTEAFTVCPLTLDHDLLKIFLEQAQIGMVEEQTAIGKAISSALNRLRVGDEKPISPVIPSKEIGKSIDNKVIILVTDGVNNVFTGMDPVTAARAAQALNIKIYSIGVGSEGMAPFPHPRFPGRVVQVPVEIDEVTLREIASITGGQYFRAQNTQALEKIFSIINDMEKTEIESYKYTRYSELFWWPLLLGLVVFLIEIILSHTVYRRFP
ncbi:VWA domain-containing protein [bacterium]|nr:VWA domain-containing protein [candidate division CSSED10-310 bacterium]